MSQGCEEHHGDGTETPKVQKVRKRRRPIDSAGLFQAYLRMIPKKKRNKNLVAEKNIQPSSFSSAVCENGETFNAETTHPIALQKESNNKESARGFLKPQSCQKRQDKLAESSEAFLPILGHSKELSDSPEKLGISEPSSCDKKSKPNDI
ncbi:uncharacterized protein [Halyomorpha halys]|uniref:uncharacterized protein isoform X2 n=1 Tax=Halyomorpha halys TaxID=286706 RepID=UPI0006D51332|nr:uncharacterized protein LOC106691213 isoform X2 [Halyomorpha halys]